MNKIRKIDSHIHLWDLSQKKNSWLLDEVEESFIGDYTTIRQNYTMDNYLKDIKDQNVTKAVAIQAGWDHADPVGETKWLQSLADIYGFPHGIVGYANLIDPDVERILNEHLKYANFRGIRQVLNWNTNPYYSGCDQNYIELDEWQTKFSLLAKYDLSFDMQIYPTQILKAINIARRYPDVSIILNHAGMPLNKGKEEFLIWKKHLKEISKLPNITIKISGLGMFDHNWTVDSIRPIILTVIDFFGIDRCMFGSNFPVDKLYSSYDVLLKTFYKVFSDCSLYELNKLFYENASKVYKL